MSKILSLILDGWVAVLRSGYPNVVALSSSLEGNIILFCWYSGSDITKVFLKDKIHGDCAWNSTSFEIYKYLVW
jgi:hypothetical protein